MLSFDVGENSFNFRSAAVVIKDGHLLLHRKAQDGFWALPGGRVEFFETSAEAVSRELREELGCKVSVSRQLWQVENFFNLNGRKCHELGNYFLVSVQGIPVESEVDFLGVEKTVTLVFRWVPLAKVTSYNFRPQYLKTRFGQLPSSLESICVNETNL